MDKPPPLKSDLPLFTPIHWQNLLSIICLPEGVKGIVSAQPEEGCFTVVWIPFWDRWDEEGEDASAGHQEHWTHMVA